MTHLAFGDIEPFGGIEPLGPWTAHIEAMDQALAEGTPQAAVGAWQRAYSAGLSDSGWRGLFTVATASLRLRALPGLTGRAIVRAREAYWIAFFRARQQRSLDGILSAAAAFEGLGDYDAFEKSLRTAEVLATRTGDTTGVDRVRIFIERLAGRNGMARQEL